MDPVIDTAEIARIFGLSREHVTDRLIKRPDFPKPAISISQRTRFWRRADVLAFLQGHSPDLRGSPARAMKPRRVNFCKA